MGTNGKKEITELRRRRILDELRRRGAIRTVELARYFAVPPMTIRNDLGTLAERGLVERVHGGAMLKSPLANEPSYFEKTQLNLAEKQAIGRKAASLIEEGMVLFRGLCDRGYLRHVSYAMVGPWAHRALDGSHQTRSSSPRQDR